MIARRLKRTGQTAENRFVIVVNHRGLAVEQRGCAYNLPAKDFTNALITKTHPHQGTASGDPPNDIAGDPCFCGGAWPGRDDDLRRGQSLDLSHGDLIVTIDPNVCA